MPESTHIRWLVIWYNGMADKTEASLIDDDRTDPKLPFDLFPHMIDPACAKIMATVLCADAPVRPMVVIDGQCVMGGQGEDRDDLLPPDNGCDQIERVIADNRDSDVTVSPNWPKIRALIVKQLGVEEAKVEPTAKFVDDLGADSMDLLELAMAFEDAFDIPEITDTETAQISTVADTVRLIELKRGSR